MGVTSSRPRNEFHVDENLPPYVYEKLPAESRCFRLFHLEPQKTKADGQSICGELGGVLRGRITIENLDRCSEYEALSYCWEGSIEPVQHGNPEKDGILIEMPDGTVRQLLIWTQLSTALRYLRARGQLLPMFIDQICINQSNAVGEKNQQVSLMGDIYRSCARVVAWLDVATEKTDEFFDWVPCISGNTQLKTLSEQQERSAKVLKVLMKRTNDPEEKIVPDSGDDDDLEQDVMAITDLAQRYWSRFPHHGFSEISMRRWFRRMWIIQEGCLGPELIFLCGRRSCSAQELEMTIVFQRLASSQDKPSFSTSIISVWWDDKKPGKSQTREASIIPDRLLMQRANIWRPGQPGRETRQRLIAIINRFSLDTFAIGPWARLEASDPHDYIYALMGLANKDDPLLMALKPDYEKPIEKVYTDVAHQILDPAIDCLLLSRPELKSEKLKGLLPSWVPDWSTGLVLPHGYKLASIPMFSAGNAPGESQPPQLDLQTHRILKAKGIQLCEIQQLGTHSIELSPNAQKPRPGEPPQMSSKITLAFFRDIKKLCDGAKAKPDCASIRKNGLDEALWVTATGGHGLSLTIDGGPLGREVDGKPLLGHVWETEIRKDVFPTIMKAREDGLAAVAASWNAATEGDKNVDSSVLRRLWSHLVYWAQWLRVEVFNLYLCYRFFVVRPFIMEAYADMLYYSVFGIKVDLNVPQLSPILERHIGRKGFASEAGHVGLVPKTTQLGDVVVVILGASTPVVLRPRAEPKGTYSYVGEAYCHGFMHGEAVTERKQEARWFEIH
jgi:hypothetical protein